MAKVSYPLTYVPRTLASADNGASLIDVFQTVQRKGLFVHRTTRRHIAAQRYTRFDRPFKGRFSPRDWQGLQEQHRPSIAF